MKKINDFLKRVGDDVNNKDVIIDLLEPMRLGVVMYFISEFKRNILKPENRPHMKAVLETKLKSDEGGEYDASINFSERDDLRKAYNELKSYITFENDKEEGFSATMTLYRPISNGADVILVLKFI